jgi:hypothetical protein
VAAVVRRRRACRLSLDYLPVRSELARALARDVLTAADKEALAAGLARAAAEVDARPAQNVFEGRVEGMVLRRHDSLSAAFAVLDPARSGWVTAEQWARAMAETLGLDSQGRVCH